MKKKKFSGKNLNRKEKKIFDRQQDVKICMKKSIGDMMQEKIKTCLIANSDF